MAPKRARSPVSGPSTSCKRGRGARGPKAHGRGSSSTTNIPLAKTNETHGSRRGRGRGARRGQPKNKRGVTGLPSMAPCFIPESDSDSDSGPMSYDLGTSESDSSASYGDHPSSGCGQPISNRDQPNNDRGQPISNRDHHARDRDQPISDRELKLDEELTGDESTVTEKLMSVVCGALPALRGPLAAHARDVLGARPAHPLADMLRTLARFTTSVIPNRKKSGNNKDTRANGTTMEQETIPTRAMEESAATSPELSYLWSQSWDQRKFPNSDDTLVSTSLESNEPSTSKCNLMSKINLDSTSPRNGNPTPAKYESPTHTNWDQKAQMKEDITENQGLIPLNGDPTPQINGHLTQKTNWNPTSHLNRDPRLHKRDPRIHKNLDPTPQTDWNDKLHIKSDPTQHSIQDETPQTNCKATLNINEDPTQLIHDLTQTDNYHTPKIKADPTFIFDLTQTDDYQTPKIEADPTLILDLTQTDHYETPDIKADLTTQLIHDFTQTDNYQTSNLNTDLRQASYGLMPHINGRLTQGANCDPTSPINGGRTRQIHCDPAPRISASPAWGSTLDLTLGDDDDLDSMLRSIDDITSMHEQRLLHDDEDLDQLPEINMPTVNAFDRLMRSQQWPHSQRQAGRAWGRSAGAGGLGRAPRRPRARPRARARARAPRERPDDLEYNLPQDLSFVNDISPAAARAARSAGPFQLPDDGKEEDAEADVEMGVAETYADYTPAKLKTVNGVEVVRHPDPVVETASLSSVDTADVSCQLSLPADTVRRGLLSGLQLEAVVYASQAHDHLLPDGTRAGFLIGDGAGVGKGRTIAGLIFENHLKGRRRALWISVSNDLKYDAERDLRDIGAGTIRVHPLNKMKYSAISGAANGCVTEGVVFSTYSALIGYTSARDAEHNTRLKQLLEWCGPDFDGCIVFDECHRAKNLCPVTAAKPSKTGLAVLGLQQALPKARLVYASATGASEPKNMAYMVRLGIWGEGTPFPAFQDFLHAVEKKGVGAMEIVAMDMKLRGMYIARQLSFHGVTFKIEEVPLSDAFRDTYDKAVALWVKALAQFEEALQLVNPSNKWRKIMWAQFWGAHQRFFKYLCIAAKVGRTVARALEAVRGGQCAVVGLQSTGEARTLDQLGRGDGRLSEFICTAKGVFQSLVEKQFPDPDNMKPEDLPDMPLSPDVRPLVQDMKQDLLKRIHQLGRALPHNSLDQLVDELGGADQVAEMTGRKGRVVQTEDGQILYESRSEADVPLETLNLTEKQRFMDGEKNIAIISEAASSGISLQSDRRVKNHRRRVHITLELPWSADRAIQQFGRTHRSNQVNAPEYIFLISDLAGERRFASTVAKRLESLGALTHGDRRATETRDLSQFNIENKYGRMALRHVREAVRGAESPLVAPPPEYAGDFLRDAAAALAAVGLHIDTDQDTNAADIQRFLNRLLGVPVKLQNALFQYFSDTFEAIVLKEKRKGQFDLGILDLGSAGECVRRVRSVRFLRHHATGSAPVELHTVYSERGLPWDKAVRLSSGLTDPDEGFYLSSGRWNNNYNAILCVNANNNNNTGSRDKKMFNIYRPNVGLQVRQESLADVRNKYQRASQEAAAAPWQAQYDKSLSICSHAYWHGSCRTPRCEVGLRVRKYHVLSGSVLAVWALLEAVMKQLRLYNRMQVVRVKTTDGLKIVGTLLPECCIELLTDELKNEAIEVSDKTFQ